MPKEVFSSKLSTITTDKREEQKANNKESNQTHVLHDYTINHDSDDAIKQNKYSSI